MYIPSQNELDMMIAVMESSEENCRDLLAAMPEDAFTWMMTLLRCVKGSEPITPDWIQSVFDSYKEAIVQ